MQRYLLDSNKSRESTTLIELSKVEGIPVNKFFNASTSSTYILVLDAVTEYFGKKRSKCRKSILYIAIIHASIVCDTSVNADAVRRSLGVGTSDISNAEKMLATLRSVFPHAQQLNDIFSKYLQTKTRRSLLQYHLDIVVDACKRDKPDFYNTNSPRIVRLVCLYLAMVRHGTCSDINVFCKRYTAMQATEFEKIIENFTGLQD